MLKDKQGKSVILELDFDTFEYKEKKKAKFQAMDDAKPIIDIRERVKVLLNSQDKAGGFYRATFYPLFDYVSKRIPEITDNFYKIDDALVAGFAWELGPFEVWDAIGVSQTIGKMKEAGFTPAQWVTDMIDSGATSFYKSEQGKKMYYDIDSKSYKIIPGTENLVSLQTLRHTNTLWKNKDSSIIDLGDGVLNLEFHAKMNIIGPGIMQGMKKAVDLAEKEYKALVISNEGENFSAGANVGMMFMMAVEQEWDELHFAIRTFQKAITRMRFSSIPVIAAPHGLTLGGGCELSMHCDKVIAHAETYMGLVEFGVGLLPGGGGTK